MTELPAALRGWAAELDGLSDVSRTAFAPWLSRLAAALGPFVEPRAADDGEPEGFDGIARRGRYERLLASEWLLADEAPLEFLRRAAAGEQLFRTLARRQPTHSRCCLVLLDAGPAQLGEPRLAQLALLIVLARRAREAGARLCWGTVQVPGRLREGFEGEAVRAMLDARTLTPITSEHLQGWAAHLDAIGLAADERWLVSAPDNEALATAHRFRSTITIAEALPDPARDFARSLRVAIHDGDHQRPRRELSLPLPDERLAAALLHDPTRRPPPRPQRASPTRWSYPPPEHIWTDGLGRRLFARTPIGTVLGFHIPASRVEQPGRTRLCEPPPGGVLLAATARGRHMISVSATEDELLLVRGGDHRRAVAHTLGDSLLAEAIDHARRNVASNRLVGGDPYLLLTGEGVLLQLRPAIERRLEVRVVATRVVGVSLDGQRVVVDHPSGQRLLTCDAAGELSPLGAPDLFYIRGFVGFGWSNALLEPLLFRAPDRGLHLWIGREHCLAPHLSELEALIGPFARRDREHTVAGLLLIDASRRRIIQRTLAGEQCLAELGAEISAATLCTQHSGLIVAWTVDHELWVYDLSRRSIVAHYPVPGAEEDS